MIQSVGRRVIDGDKMFTEEIEHPALSTPVQEEQGEMEIMKLLRTTLPKSVDMGMHDHQPDHLEKSVEGYILDSESGKYYNSDTGYYFDPETDLYGDAATGVWYKCKNGSFEAV